MRTLAVVLCLAVPVAAIAQSEIGFVAADLDQSGLAETFTLLDAGTGSADLLIDDTAMGSILAAEIAWVGGIGQQPRIALAPNGSVQVISMNDAIGRGRWELTLTIAYRDGNYLVAGYSYQWRDTIDLSDNGICDVNLLAGRGEVTRDGGPKITFKTAEFATPARYWNWASFGPNDACFT